MASSAVRKYMVYAIGEILLVMIGILLALQVNNRNEERKIHKLEKKFLRELNSDLKANRTEIESIFRSTERRVKAVDSIFLSFETQDETTEAFRKNVNLSISESIFNNANTSYEYMKSRGIDFLSDDSLRIRITEMYEGDFFNIHRREEMESRFIQDHLEPYLRENFRFFLFHFPGSGDFMACCEPISYEKVRQSEKFHNLLYKSNSNRRIRLRWLPITIPKLDALIADIELEIEKD